MIHSVQPVQRWAEVLCALPEIARLRRHRAIRNKVKPRRDSLESLGLRAEFLLSVIIAAMANLSTQ